MGITIKMKVRWDNFGQWTSYINFKLTYNEWIHIAVYYDNGSSANNNKLYILME